MKKLTLLLLLSSITIAETIADAKLLSPWEYGDNQCELIAKDYQREYGGALILIQPLKDNGAFDFGPYNGHFLNNAYDKEIGTYYIDYQSQSYFNNTNDALDWYFIMTNKKAIIYNVNEQHPPFSIIWHY